MSDEQPAREVSPEEYRQMVATGQVGKKPKTPVYLRRGMSMPTLAVAALLLALLIGFFVGAAYEKGKANTANTTATNANDANGQNSIGGRRGFRRSGAIGQVTAVSDSSISVNNQRTGNDQTFKITSSTTVTNNGVSASVSDIKTGDTVLIRTSTSDASTATSIMINPSFGGGPGGFSTPDQTQNNNSGSTNSNGSTNSIDSPSSGTSTDSTNSSTI